MSPFENAILTFLDLTGYLMVSNKLLDGKKDLGKKQKAINIVLMMMVLASVLASLGETPLVKYNFVTGALISISLIYYLYRKDIKESIIIYIITTIIIIIVQTIVLAPLAIFFGESALDFKIGLVAQVVILSIYLLIKKFVPINKLLDFIHYKNKVFMSLMLSMFVILISFSIYRNIKMEGLLNDILIIAFLTLGLLFVNVVIIRDGLRNKYEEQMLVTYEKYLPIIDELMGELRAKQHDYDNHLQAINMIALTSKDNDSLIHKMKKYISELDEDIEFNKLIKLENKILAGFLYNKIKKAKEMNMDFQVDIKDYGFNTSLKDYELIEILGNLIDNGLETGVEKNRVKLLLVKEDHQSVMEVMNKHHFLDSNTISKLFKTGYTTKNRDDLRTHGYGLPNVQKIIQEKKGSIMVENRDIGGENYIAFRIGIPLKQF